MRVLQVMAGAPQGGAETAFIDGCLALAEAGVTIEAVTRGNNPHRLERLRQAGIAFHILPFGGILDVLTKPRLRRIIARFKPDIVQTWMNRAADKTPAWRKGSGVPPYALIARLGGYYKLRHYKGTDFFVTLTPDLASWLQGQGIEQERIRQIPNFAETDADAAPIDRAAEGTPADAPLAVALGRLHRAKAFDILLQAAAEIPALHVWIAGEGPERAALEGQIGALGLESRVRLLGWRNDRAALLKAADLCVFPSRYEPFGTVFLQAWANRIPLVVSAADGPRQFVRDGEDGLVVPIDDAKALAAAVRRIIEDKDLRRRLGDAGYERYRNKFSKERIVAAYIDCYKKAAFFKKTR